MLKRRNIGIIGGAGVRAGLYVADRITQGLVTGIPLTATSADDMYPSVALLNAPLAGFQASGSHSTKTVDDIKSRANVLQSIGCTEVVLACNTLAHIVPQPGIPDLLVPALVTVAAQKPLSTMILCSSTLHEAAVAKGAASKLGLNIVVPDREAIDRFITEAIAGDPSPEAFAALIATVNAAAPSTVVIACTEISMYKDRLLTELDTLALVDTVDVLVQHLSLSYNSI